MERGLLVEIGIHFDIISFVDEFKLRGVVMLHQNNTFKFFVSDKDIQLAVNLKLKLNQIKRLVRKIDILKNNEENLLKPLDAFLSHDKLSLYLQDMLEIIEKKQTALIESQNDSYFTKQKKNCEKLVSFILVSLALYVEYLTIINFFESRTQSDYRPDLFLYQIAALTCLFSGLNFKIHDDKEHLSSLVTTIKEAISICTAMQRQEDSKKLAEETEDKSTVRWRMRNVADMV